MFPTYWVKFNGRILTQTKTNGTKGREKKAFFKLRLTAKDKVRCFYGKANVSQQRTVPYLCPDVLFRAPAFSVQASLDAVFRRLKAAIRLSSPDFYAIIEDLQTEDLKNRPEKVKFTIWKYFNRARFRATPYGLFAAVGMGTLGYDRDAGIVLSDNTEVKSFIDWPFKDTEALSYTFEDLIRDNKKVFANGSYYRSSADIRYLSFTEGKFELSDVGYSNFLETVCVTAQNRFRCRMSSPYEKPVFSLIVRQHPGVTGRADRITDAVH
ncbi:MAG: lantibiotic dehydratase [Arachidicoccus sp.]|nr:lantibiotic dehydratase [Arachidicoccus sp.]